MSTKTSLIRYLFYLASRLFFSLQNKSNHGNEITNSLRFLSTEKGERKEINKCFAKTGQFKYHSQCCQTFGLHKIKISFHVESFWPCLLFQFVWGASHLHLEHGLQWVEKVFAYSTSFWISSSTFIYFFLSPISILPAWCWQNGH